MDIADEIDENSNIIEDFFFITFENLFLMFDD